MESIWVAVLLVTGILALFLLIKILLMKRSAQEISEKLPEILSGDTNTLIDISSKDKSMRKLADSINKQLAVLRRERLRYTQGDKELKTAITNISHDLRTPLTAICGYLDIMKNEEKSEKLAGYLDIIKDRAALMKQLTEELFRYSVILSRVFANIIGNALKYSDGNLRITLDDNGIITFSNTASSLDKVDVGRLFERFYTVESARNSTGLGLSIARNLVERMGGTITAEYLCNTLYIRIDF